MAPPALGPAALGPPPGPPTGGTGATPGGAGVGGIGGAGAATVAAVATLEDAVAGCAAPGAGAAPVPACPRIGGAPPCPGEMATVPPSPRAAAAGAPPAAFAAAFAFAARMPCGGVCGENGLGAVPRGSSAPHPRQNL